MSEYFNKIALQQNGCKTKAQKGYMKKPREGKRKNKLKKDLNTRAQLQVHEKGAKRGHRQKAQKKSASSKGIHEICKKRASTKTIL